MAAYDLEEQDKLEDLKAFWDRYGGAITTGIVLACLLVLGVQAYRWWTGHRAEQASVLYSAVSEAARKNEPPKARDAMAELADRYASTGYAPRAALLYARMLYDAGDRAGAKTQFAWVIDHADEEELKAIARYRLAQMQFDDKQYDAALQTLDAKHPDAFDGVFADLRGDILTAAGKQADARAAYQDALAKIDAKSPYHAYVQVKLDAVGGAAGISGSALGGSSAGAKTAQATPPMPAAAPQTQPPAGSAATQPPASPAAKP
ncbi:MAG TPA: tetratricopeptide repeat protein [Casimicrobiaceae bacterium]|nr:tetratricopeptide repeat protein [Casimicrobiaceae bacterium]